MQKTLIFDNENGINKGELTNSYDVLGTLMVQPEYNQGKQTRYKAITFNCMSARDWARMESIQDELGDIGVVALQGTRIPQTQSIEQIQHSGWLTFHPGYGPNTNCLSGVSLMLNTKIVDSKSMHRYWVPNNPSIQDRISGLREKGRRRDIFHITAYFPP